MRQQPCWNITKLLLILITLWLAHPALLIAEGDEPTASTTKAASVSADPFLKTWPLSLGALAGIHIDPENIAGALHADFYLNRYISVGPLVQVSGLQSRFFFTTTAGGRFHIPLSFIKDTEFNYQLGAGYFFKRDQGFSFHNFIVTTGPGVSHFLKPNLALQLVSLANISNDNVYDLFYSVLAGVEFFL